MKDTTIAGVVLGAHKKTLREVDRRLDEFALVPGPTGPAGNNGVDGAQGVQGSTGAQGTDGKRGNQGIKGDKGETGEQGLQGTAGAQGSAGEDGASGPQGIAGRNGRDGNDGIGVQGPTGSPGRTGDRGVKGDRGETGPQGPIGVTGASGNDGAQGVQGPQGQGIQGTNGSQGSQGTIGAQGSTGADGIQGATGAQGLQGEPGPMPDIAPVSDKLASDFTKFRNRVNQSLASLGGGGSYKLLDNADVEQKQLSQVTQNAILIYNVQAGKFIVSDIEEVILSLGLDLGGGVQQYSRLVDVEGTFTYIGEATPGTAESAASWRIKRLFENPNGDLTILWANGTADFDKVWDNRTSFTYS